MLAPTYDLLTEIRLGPEVDPDDTKSLDDWEPHDTQKIALASPADEIFFGGARGGGKSDWLLADFAAFAEKYGDKARGALFRRTIDEHRDLKLKAIKMFAGRAEWRESEKTWRFHNGAILLMSYLSSMEDVSNYMGHEYTWLGFDELTEWPSGEAYEFMGSMMRAPKAAGNIPKLRRATGNPGRPGHAWVREYFIDKVPYGHIYRDPATGRTRQFIPSFLTDNPHLLHNDDYINQLRTLNPTLRRAFLDGDWNVFVGQAFPEWDQTQHILPARRFRIDPRWRQVSALDWGTHKPYAWLFFTATPDRHIVCYREAYGQKPGAKANVGTHESVRRVAEREWENTLHTPCDTVIVDPSMDQEHGHGMSLADHIRAVGWNVELGMGGTAGRMQGKGSIHNLLQAVADDGLPVLQFLSTCHYSTKTIPALPIAQKGLNAHEDVDTDAEDHAYDALRYFATSEIANSNVIWELVEEFAAGSIIDESASQWDPNDPKWMETAGGQAWRTG